MYQQRGCLQLPFTERQVKRKADQLLDASDINEQQLNGATRRGLIMYYVQVWAIDDAPSPFALSDVEGCVPGGNASTSLNTSGMRGAVGGGVGRCAAHLRPNSFWMSPCASFTKLDAFTTDGKGASESRFRWRKSVQKLLLTAQKWQKRL